MTRWNRREFIQATTAPLLFGGMKALALHGRMVNGNDPLTTFVHTNTEDKSWTVGNSLVEREICFDPKLGLHTTSWRHKVTGTDFMQAAPQHRSQGDEFSFQADAESCVGSNGAAWQFIEAKTQKLTPDGESLAIALRSTSKPIEVTVFYAVYDAYPVIRKWMAITNRGKESIILSHLSFESVRIMPCVPENLQASAFYGIQPRELLFSGRVDDSVVIERNSSTGEGFIVMNEAPGWTKRTELMDWGYGVQCMYDTDLFPFERALQSGETFTSAKSSMAFFVDGKGFADPRWIMPSYTSHLFMKKGPSYQPPWIYNTWEPFERGITRDIVMDLIEAASRIGMDVFTIDDGWQSEYGDNAINRKLFPNGLDEVQAAVEKNGMRLGLWSPLTVIGTDTPAYRAHPEWVCKDRNGKPKFTETMSGSRAVMCLASPYKEISARRISDLIGRYNLRYVKIDLTTVFNAYGESPGCYATDHDHGSWAQSLEGIYEGIQYVTDHIYSEHPDVLLDITFEVWGQKHTIDYGLLGAGDVDWLSNVEDRWPDAAGPRQARTLLYHRSLAVPAETMLIGNLQAEMGSIEERLVTAMGAGPLLLGDLRKLSAEQQAWYGEKIRWFKALRKEVPMLEGFFPLGEWKGPGAVTWDGFARLSRQGEGMIAVFKNESHLQEVIIELPVFPDGAFVLRSVITGRAQASYTGEQFRHGIRLQLPAEHKVEVLEIRRGPTSS